MIAHTYPSTRFSPAISYSLSVSASSPMHSVTTAHDEHFVAGAAHCAGWRSG